MQQVWSWFIQSQTEKPSKISKTGSKKSTKASLKLLAKSLSATNPTAVIRRDKSLMRKENNWLRSMGSSLWKAVLKKTRTLRISLTFWVEISRKVSKIRKNPRLKRKITSRSTIRRNKLPKTVTVDFSCLFICSFYLWKLDCDFVENSSRVGKLDFDWLPFG